MPKRKGKTSDSTKDAAKVKPTTETNDHEDQKGNNGSSLHTKSEETCILEDQRPDSELKSDSIIHTFIEKPNSDTPEGGVENSQTKSDSDADIEKTSSETPKEGGVENNKTCSDNKGDLVSPTPKQPEKTNIREDHSDSVVSEIENVATKTKSDTCARYHQAWEKYKPHIMNIFWYFKTLIMVMSAVWIPSSVVIIYNQQDAITNLKQVHQLPVSPPSNGQVSSQLKEPENKMKASESASITSLIGRYLPLKHGQKEMKSKLSVHDRHLINLTNRISDQSSVFATQNELIAANSTLNDKINRSNVDQAKMERRFRRDINSRYAIMKRTNTCLFKELQSTKISQQEMSSNNTKMLSALQIAQDKEIRRLRRNVNSNHAIMKRETERNRECLSDALDTIKNLTTALGGTQKDQIEVKTYLFWLGVGVFGLFVIVYIAIFVTKARMKDGDFEQNRNADSTKPGGRIKRNSVKKINPGTDFVMFTFTHNTEQFLKTSRCTMMTQLKQLPCFAEKIVQEIYIPDNPDLGPLETSVRNVKGCICVYEYNDRDIILESPTELETKKRDTLELLKRASDATGMNLLVLYMFDPRSAKLWNGEIYNTLIGQTYGDDILSQVANAGQFISINKEFIKLQLDQIQIVLQ